MRLEKKQSPTQSTGTVLTAEVTPRGDVTLQPVVQTQKVNDALVTGSGGVDKPSARVVETKGQTVGHSPTGMLEKLRKVEEGKGGAGQVFAAIDMGSSSTKMLILGVQKDGSWKTLLDIKQGTSLGKSLPADGGLPEENQQRALKALQRFVALAAEHGVAAKDIGMITTAAVRNAPNGADFIQRIHDEAGLTRARILSGEEEAETGYLGAISALRGKGGDRFATLDLGGGSFQLAIGSSSRVEDGGSTQIGSNYVLEKLLGLGTVSDATFAKADEALKKDAPMPMPVEQLTGRTLVALGGVSKFVRAHLGKDEVTRAEIDALRREAGRLEPQERVALVQRGKDQETMVALGVDTEAGARDYGVKLPASCTLLLHIMDGLGVNQIHVSSTDARHAVIDRLSREA